MPYQPCSLRWRKKHQGRFQSTLFVMDQKIFPVITLSFVKALLQALFAKLENKQKAITHSVQMYQSPMNTELPP